MTSDDIKDCPECGRAVNVTVNNRCPSVDCSYNFRTVATDGGVVMSDPVDALLTVEEGQKVRLEAAHYEWGSPFVVEEIDEQSWRAPGERVWRSRRVELEATDPRGSDRSFDVYPDGPAPDCGPGYGRLAAVRPVVDEEEEGGEKPPEGDEDDGPDVDLPDGVTEDDVVEAARSNVNLGDVAAEIGVTRGRARTITVALGCYSDVKDLPQGGRA